MTKPSQSFDSDIDAQALAWFGRREGGLTPQEEGEFQAWLEADPRHAEHYGQLDEIWTLSFALKERVAAPSAVDYPLAPRRSAFRRGWIPTALAAAATIAIGLYLWRRPDPSFVRYAIVTEVGGIKKLELPDGSVVRLNSDTAVAVELTKSERRIALERGEAHFTVAKDPSRPFVVTAAGVSVRAVGTAFNVSLKSASLEVFVNEGKVKVEEKSRASSTTMPSVDLSPVLEAGHKIVVDLKPVPITQPMATVVPVAPPEAERTLAWQAKMLEFDDRPLREIIAEFNRYNQHQLVLLDEALARRTFGGTFRADDYAVLVELLERQFAVIAERSGQQTTLRVRTRR